MICRHLQTGCVLRGLQFALSEMKSQEQWGREEKEKRNIFTKLVKRGIQVKGQRALRNGSPKVRTKCKKEKFNENAFIRGS